MVTQTALPVITAVDAAEFAGITYRQLDHWARKGWVTPSIGDGPGRGSRRLYSCDDILKLSSLRHFALSGWQLSGLGPLIADLEFAGASWLVAGPEPGLITVSDVDELAAVVTEPGRFTCHQLDPLRQQLVDQPDDGESPVDVVQIRSRKERSA